MANILVIEDQKQLCQLYGSVLSKTKHRINLAYTGEEGLDHARPPSMGRQALPLPLC